METVDVRDISKQVRFQDQSETTAHKRVRQFRPEENLSWNKVTRESDSLIYSANLQKVWHRTRSAFPKLESISSNSFIANAILRPTADSDISLKAKYFIDDGLTSNAKKGNGRFCGWPTLSPVEKSLAGCRCMVRTWSLEPVAEDIAAVGRLWRARKIMCVS